MFHRVTPEHKPKEAQKETEEQAVPASEKATETTSEKTTDSTDLSTEDNTTDEQTSDLRKTADHKPSNTENTQEDTPTMNQFTQGTPADTNTNEQAQTGTFEKVTSSYQRPGQAPVAQQAAPYASTYAAPTAPVTHETAQTGERMLTIGRGITMSGEIDSCDYLLVEGTVEAALKGASVLDISESGTFYGTVEIDEATVAGRFEGDITVNGRLTIRAGGIVTGSIAYKELEVESGAVIDGRLTPVSVAKPVQVAKPMSKPAAKVDQTPAKVDVAPANTDGGLFSNKATS